MLIDRYENYSDIKDSILKGASFLTYNIGIRKSELLVEVASGDRLFNPFLVEQRLYRNGMPYTIPVIDESYFDEETFSISKEELNYLSGYVVGEFTTQTMNYYDTIETDVLADVLGSSWCSIMNGNYSDAFSCLQSAMSLVTLAKEETLETIRGNSNSREANSISSISLRV